MGGCNDGTPIYGNIANPEVVCEYEDHIWQPFYLCSGGLIEGLIAACEHQNECAGVGE